MRYGEETLRYKGTDFSIFHDVMNRWFWEVGGRPRYIGVDLAVYNNFAKEREVAVEMGKLFIDCKV